MRSFDVTINVTEEFNQIKDPESRFEKKSVNKIMINEAKMPILLVQKFRLKPSQTIMATFRMTILQKFCGYRQVPTQSVCSQLF